MCIERSQTDRQWRGTSAPVSIHLTLQDTHQPQIQLQSSNYPETQLPPCLSYLSIRQVDDDINPGFCSVNSPWSHWWSWVTVHPLNQQVGCSFPHNIQEGRSSLLQLMILQKHGRLTHQPLRDPQSSLMYFWMLTWWENIVALLGLYFWSCGLNYLTP